MAAWHRSLDAAGISEPRLRDDYTQQRRLVARFNRSAYISAGLLLPPALLPHIYAATAFMHHSDNLLDRGPLEERVENFAVWEKQVRAALADGQTDHPVLRPLLHTAGNYPQLRERVEDYIQAAPADLRFTGFATEQDYQSYIDDYSLPAFMLVTCLLVPASALPAYRQACRVFIEAMQRLDFLNDLAEDLPDGRLTIPQETMDLFDVTRSELERGRFTDPHNGLIGHISDQVETGLRAAYPIVDLTPPEHRPLVRALFSLQERLLTAARKKGPALLHGPARPAILDVARILLRERRRARRRQRPTR